MTSINNSNNRGESSLPLNLFDACDPRVEDLLSGLAGNLLLQQMAMPAQFGAAPPMTPEDAIEIEHDFDRDPAVSDEEIDGFVAAWTNSDSDLTQEASQPPPLDEGTEVERVWVLADLATTASGLARQRATRVLRDVMEEIQENIEDDVLQTIVRDLARHDDSQNDGETPVLIQILRAAVRRAVDARALAQDSRSADN